MNGIVTVWSLLEDFLAERHALGYRYKTDEGAIRRFLKDFPEPAGESLEFTKEYVLSRTQRKPNQKTNTVLRDISAINAYLDFVQRRGFSVYKIPPKSLPKESRNFHAYIFTEDEIERMLAAARRVPYTNQNPIRQYQLPVMFCILFNCGLRTSELLRLRLDDVDMERNVFTVLETKFHKNRLVPFSGAVAEALKEYFQQVPTLETWLFPGPKASGVYSLSGLNSHFRMLLRMAGIPHGGRGKGPRPHDIRHTFAVHCLNRWVLSGEDLTAALPVLSRYLGHNNLKGTQKYLQLTAQMYPDILQKVEDKFGRLIPFLEVPDETC